MRYRIDTDDAQGEGSDKLTFSSVAEEQIGKLEVGTQQQLAAELVRVYGNSLRFLVKIQFQTFVHKGDIALYNTLCQDKFTLSVCDCAMRVEANHTDHSWHILSVGPPGSLKGFDCKSLSNSDS